MDVGIARGITKDAPVAHIVVDDPLDFYNLWAVANFAISPFPGVVQALDDVTTAAFIAVDTKTTSIFLGDSATNTVIDASASWYDDF